MKRVFADRPMWVVLLLASVALSCDSVPAGELPLGRPGEITAFAFSPQVIDLATLPPEQQTDSTITVPFTVNVSVVAGDAPVETVWFVLQGLEVGDDPVTQGALPPSEGGGFGAAFDLTLDKGSIGNYSVLVFAVDGAGGISNRVRGIVRFGSSVPVGGPPVIVDVEGDPEVVQAGSTFRLIAQVTDPEGLSNVLRVEATGPNQTPFEMLDDGGLNGSISGDDLAGDGRFTVTFEVPSTTPPGTVLFMIQAFDRSGLESEVFEKEITIE